MLQRSLLQPEACRCCQIKGLKFDRPEYYQQNKLQYLLHEERKRVINDKKGGLLSGLVGD
jgi:hypothetical protein